MRAPAPLEVVLISTVYTITGKPRALGKADGIENAPAGSKPTALARSSPGWVTM